MPYRFDKSYRELAKAKKIRPGGVSATRLPYIQGASPVYLVRGKGSHVWDIDGNEFIDWMSSIGPNILGYANPEVNRAVKQQMDKGFLFSLSHPLPNKLSEKLRRIYPAAEMVLLAKTGSEATLGAVRLARAHTGRWKIVRCGYHGWHDWSMQGKGTTHPSSRLPCGFVPHLPGIPSVRGIVYNWDGDDTEYLEGLFRKQGEQIACLIIDPPALTEPIRDKLALARRLTKKYGAVLIYDEVKTGFRVSLGGVQEYYGIRPDLTTLSKAMANGFPLAAILGKKKIMQHNPYIWGTFIGDVLAVVASLKTIEILERRNSIKFLWGMGERLIGGLNRIISGLGIEEHVSAVGWNWPTMPFVLFKGKGEAAEEVKKTFYKVITGRGVLMYATHMNFINLSHTAADLSDTLTICEEGLKAAKAGWRKS